MDPCCVEDHSGRSDRQGRHGCCHASARAVLWCAAAGPACCLPHVQHQLCRQQCSNVLCAHDAGAELFLFLTMWCCLVVLPTNLSVRAQSPH